MPDPRHLLIGRIAGAHGIAGVLKLISYAESLEVFAPGARLLAAGEGREQVFEVGWAKPHGRAILLSLRGVESQEQAQALTGWELFIDRAALPALEPGTYYWADLIGIEVYEADGRRLGRLVSIFPTGSNDVYVVQQDGRELLLPALATVIKHVDLAARRMEVALPEGLD